MLYVPGGSCATVYVPVSFVITVRAAPVAAFVIVTSTAGITAPVGSLTLPVTAVNPWANAPGCNATNIAMATNPASHLKWLEFLFILCTSTLEPQNDTSRTSPHRAPSYAHASSTEAGLRAHAYRLQTSSSRRFLSVRSIPSVQEKRSVFTTHKSFIPFACKLFDPALSVKFYGEKKPRSCNRIGDLNCLQSRPRGVLACAFLQALRILTFLSSQTKQLAAGARKVLALLMYRTGFSPG